LETNVRQLSTLSSSKYTQKATVNFGVSSCGFDFKTTDLDPSKVALAPLPKTPGPETTG